MHHNVLRCAAMVIAVMGLCVAAQDTVKLLRADVYLNSATCSGTPVSAPFGVDGACNTLGNAFSWQINCATNSRDFFIGRNCSGAATPQEFGCVTGIANGNNVVRPAVGFSCGDYPANRVVVVTVGTGGCPNAGRNITRHIGREIPTIKYSFALITNTCLPVPRQFGNTDVPDGFYKITVSADKTVTLEYYNALLCLGDPTDTYSAKVNECATVSGGGIGGSGRLLAAGDNIAFETATDVDLATTGAAGFVSAGLVSMVATVLAVMSVMA